MSQNGPFYGVGTFDLERCKGKDGKIKARLVLKQYVSYVFIVVVVIIPLAIFTIFKEG